MANEIEGKKIKIVFAVLMILIGIVLVLSCLYNGFWTGEYSKATFHGIAGFVLINTALSMD